jgi:uncharacterized protein YdiU (UPF0061 family)
VFSSIDHGGRYAYGNQPLIARWNLARLAETLLPLMADAQDEAAAQAAVAQVTGVIDAFALWYGAALLAGQRAKLGLLADADGADDAADTALAEDWLALLKLHAVDFTLAWRRLCDAAAGDANPLRALFAEPSAINPWLARWQARCQRADDAGRSASAGASPEADRAARMRGVNPWVIPRNHRVEEALAAATEQGDLAPFRQLMAVLGRPFVEDAEFARYAQPAPPEVTAGYQTFCGT